MQIDRKTWDKLFSPAAGGEDLRRRLNEHLAAQEPPKPAEVDGDLVEKMIAAYAEALGTVVCCSPTNVKGMAAAARVCLDARDAQWEKAIQEGGDRISWQGFGAETTFAKAVKSRLLAPAVKADPRVEAIKAVELVELRRKVFSAINQFQDIYSWQEGESRNALISGIRDKVDALFIDAATGRSDAE